MKFPWMRRHHEAREARLDAENLLEVARSQRVCADEVREDLVRLQRENHFALRLQESMRRAGRLT